MNLRKHTRQCHMQRSCILLSTPASKVDLPLPGLVASSQPTAVYHKFTFQSSASDPILEHCFSRRAPAYVSCSSAYRCLSVRVYGPRKIFHSRQLMQGRWEYVRPLPLTKANKQDFDCARLSCMARGRRDLQHLWLSGRQDAEQLSQRRCGRVQLGLTGVL